jgi:predicted TIM-barrel fold metal-dependent hydrolase
MIKSRVIALEEHYWDAELARQSEEKAGAPRAPETDIPALRERLLDVGALRLKEMDEAGIDLQILSHGAPGVQRMDAAVAVPLARRVNDRLHDTVKANPTRFAAFAVLPTPDPIAAADELERTVTKFGFKGAMLHGLTREGEFLDLKRFWPIYERAEALGVPIYIHPAVPHRAVIDVYYKDYLQDFPEFMTAAWGFTVETATQAIRLVLSGVFEKHPRLNIILGHMGEGLPFLLWRIDMALKPRMGKFSKSFRDTFRERFWITTSGNFSTASLICCMLEMGADRVLFSVDYPFVPNPPGVNWMNEAPISPEDREKILSGNATRLFRL